METRAIRLRCPDLDSQASARLAKQVLMDTPGVMDAEVSFPDQLVTVTIRDVDGEAAVRRHLIAAGFPPED